MTATAWIVLAVTWSIIVFFTTKFFLMVLRSTGGGDDPEAGLEDEEPGSSHAP